MKILVTGARGQVGSDLSRLLPTLGEVVAIDLAEMDLTRGDDIRRVLRDERPDVVVNAAAHTAVDKAESEPELARLVNAVAPGIMAQELQRTGGMLVHYSTDYVFDGTKPGAYTEEDQPNPFSVYGSTKWEGERAVAVSGVPHLILRTSWIYGARGKNFLLTMLRLFEERDELKVVNDQIGAPTWCTWVAETTAILLSRCLENEQTRAHPADWSGTYHVTAGGSTSWFGFASAIRELRYGADAFLGPRILAIPSSEYPTPARRPANSVLSNAKLKARFGIEQKPWDAMLKQCMAEVLTSASPGSG